MYIFTKNITNEHDETNQLRMYVSEFGISWLVYEDIIKILKLNHNSFHLLDVPMTDFYVISINCKRHLLLSMSALEELVDKLGSTKGFELLEAIKHWGIDSKSLKKIEKYTCELDIETDITTKQFENLKRYFYDYGLDDMYDECVTAEYAFFKDNFN